MRIQKIEFSNINSLRGEHVIDFTKEPFINQPLFAITGATGSGKTTILDVITLALFNRIPRLNTISKNEILKQNSILTRGEKEAYARVTYLCSKGEYTSEWTISTARTGNLKDYDMCVYDRKTDKAISDKKSGVSSLNEELIGLSYNQFEKSVLLAQGAFGEFLKVDKKQRGDLLEKITGTEIYRELGKLAFARSSSVVKQIGNIETVIESKERELHKKEEIQAWETQLKEHDDLLKNLDAKVVDFNKKIELKNSIENLKKQLEENQVSLDKSNKEEETFKQSHGKKLIDYQKVEAFANELSAWKNLEYEVLEKQESSAKIKKELEKNKKEIEDFSTELKTLLSHQFWTEKPLDDLANFENFVQTKQREIEVVRSDYSSICKTITTELKTIQETFNHQSEDEYERLLNLKNESEKSILSYNQRFGIVKQSEIPKLLTELDTQKEDVNKAKLNAEKLKDTLLNLKKESEKQVNLKKETQVYPQEIQKKKEALKIQKEALDIAKMKAIVLSLEDHRHNLEDGEPCPLCGAIEHPYLKDLSIKEPEVNELASLEISIQKLNKELATLETTLDLNKKRIEEIDKEISAIELLKQSLEKEWKDKYSAFNLKTDFSKEIQQIKEQESALKQVELNLKIQEVLASVLPELKKLDKKRIVGKKLKQELDLVYNEQEPIQEFVAKKERTWNTINQQTSVIQSKYETIKEDLTKLKDKQEKNILVLKDKILNLSVNTIASAYQMLLPFKEIQALREAQASIERQINKLRNTREVLQKNLSLIIENEPSESLVELKELLVENQNNITSKRKLRNDLERKIKNDIQLKEEIAELKNQISELKKDNKRWYLLNTLIGDATGNKFNSFAQELTLIQLLQLANKRLQHLSNRYILSNPNEDEDDSLMVLDKDMGGQRRSVRTLSGGETFVLSLALALALSDLASNTVQIESLFIDEGFGTLDPETLDQTLDVLERLQDEDDKMIGIISHVSALKERITTQIQVEKNGRGYSTLQLLPASL